jgi:hypothetical protein
VRDRALSIALIALIAAVRVAAAQPVSAADEAFQRGREALQVGKYQEACAAFEESQRLEPQLTTQFNIALCDEQLGKLASALALHREIAARGDNPAQRAKSAEMASELDMRVARLRIDVAVRRTRNEPVPAGLEILINGTPTTNLTDLPIDLGTSRVIARAPGYLDWSGQVTARDEKQRVTATVTLVPDPKAGPSEPRPPTRVVPVEPVPPPVDAAPRSPRKALAVVTLVGGGLALAGGAAFGLLARSKWHDAKNVCGGTTCDTPDQLARGQALADTARTRGNISTGLVIGGVVLVAGGVVLLVTAPTHDRTVAIAPSVTTSSAGLAILGRF